MQKQDIVEEDIHPHCTGCINLAKCTLVPQAGVSCKIVACSLDCGRKFHACKSSEHKLLCGNVKVECINSNYGCPVILPRKDRTLHLISCPAYIIVCCQEWDRYPIYSEKKDPRHREKILDPLGFSKSPQNPQRLDLDLALMLRDYRTLQNYCSDAEAGKCVNDSKFKISLSSSLRLFKKYQQSRYGCLYEGQGKSICIACRRAAKSQYDFSLVGKLQDADQIDKCNNVSGAGEKSWSDSDEFSSDSSDLSEDSSDSCDPDVIAMKCATVKNNVKHSFISDTSIPNSLSEKFQNHTNGLLPKSDTEEFEQITGLKGLQNCCRKQRSPVSRKKIPRESQFNKAKLKLLSHLSGSESLPNCDLENKKKFEDCGRKHLIRRPAKCAYDLEDVLRISNACTTYLMRGSKSVFILMKIDDPSLYCPEKSPRVMRCNNGDKFLNLKCQLLSSVPPWCYEYGMDFNMERRTQHTPSDCVYTFLCSQEYRRDEYCHHYKNVHVDIHSNLNGWLMERCPLAQYGCKFARRRFGPTPSVSDIVYNEVVESFGVVFDTQEHGSNCSSLNAAQSINLSDLPFDVLQCIARCLDSLSLSNLSLVSTQFRDICSTLVKDRGLVSYKWEKHVAADGKPQWLRSKCKHWSFSTHFSPIREWRALDNRNNMANHLKDCPFFDRISQKQAFRYESKSDLQAGDKRLSDPTNTDNFTKL